METVDQLEPPFVDRCTTAPMMRQRIAGTGDMISTTDPSAAADRMAAALSAAGGGAA
jgi:hypothetical protein